MSMPARNVLAGIGAACLVFAAAAGGYAFSGAYNVGADAPHTAPLQWLLAAVRERSVDAHADAVAVPRLDDPKMIVDGASHYDAMCAECHLAPGMHENEIRPGLNPKPPVLAQDPPDNAAEAFWVIKHGIKMTGMPAWGVTHSDREIWNIVAFLQRMPKLSGQEYRALVASSGDHHENDMHHAGRVPGTRM